MVGMSDWTFEAEFQLPVGSSIKTSFCASLLGHVLCIPSNSVRSLQQHNESGGSVPPSRTGTDVYIGMRDVTTRGLHCSSLYSAHTRLLVEAGTPY